MDWRAQTEEQQEEENDVDFADEQRCFVATFYRFAILKEGRPKTSHDGKERTITMGGRRANESEDSFHWVGVDVKKFD